MNAWKTTGEFAFLPAPDPLWRHTPLPLEARYNVLGVPLAFATNAPVLIELADEAFGDWGRPDSISSQPDVRLQVLLHAVPESRGAIPPLLCRSQEGYLFINRGASMGFGDRPGGFAAAFVTPELLDDRDSVRDCFLECLGLFVVCRYRRATLHAAAVVYNGRCLLLTGENGAGKSTLAYACLRSGFRLLAEDIVFAEETDDGVLARGNPWKLHLLPDAVRFFPELENAGFIEQMNGERKLRVVVRRVRPDTAVTHWPVWGVCSLSRSEDGTTRLVAPDAAHLSRALTHFKDDPLLDHSAMQAAACRLLAGRTAHLEVGADPIHAVEILRGWLETE